MHALRPLAMAYALFSTSITCIDSPTTPGLSHLYTAIADCKAGIFTTQSPKGIRTSIPIVGGNFTGPRLKGQILNLGADWGTTDPQTGIFAPDTRYQLQTDNGANIYVQTSGAMQPDKTVHLRAVFETGDKEYYWLNNIVAVGILQLIATYDDGSYSLQIDVWNLVYTLQLGNEWSNTTFVNGTTY
ncbi:hypothetical protein T440DRAFT_470619 [Plenodomus tracheiphilus IPT5]|uniref:Uncharacterized protein n=1 Tax=Plenodomus tracheiphilus IPT5 TaxID=1408161 RepID=A0A6A7AYY7_9PLEO|nr:hypothetical protein T440DRAFT_470619 [Plenodomus tracheiphilus IPT5]